MPLVSVITPLYNKAPYIVRSLESVAAQTITDLEVIVVDDGSTDGGAQLAEAIADSRFRLLRQANAGPGAARNRGLREAQAPFVAFIDSDDCWLPQFLEQNLQLLKRHPGAAAVSCGWREHPGGSFPAHWWEACGIEEGMIAISPETSAERVAAMIAYMNPSTVLARAESIRRWGGFYENGSRYGEDATLWLKVFLNEPLIFHPRPLVTLDVQASELCRNYRGARPIEPFLLDPSILIDACPQPLLPLLERFLKIRACKTASMLGYWGEWRQARELVRRFISPHDWRTPYFPVAILSSSPLVRPVGRLARSLIKR
jgi:hypothetical protein